MKYTYLLALQKQISRDKPAPATFKKNLLRKVSMQYSNNCPEGYPKYFGSF